MAIKALIYLNYTSDLLIITLTPEEKQSDERVGFLFSKQQHSIHGILIKCFVTYGMQTGEVF